MISLSGLEIRDKSNPEGDIEITFTGLRPGEKLYEELLIGENVAETSHKQIWRAEEDSLSPADLDHYLNLLQKASETNDVMALKEILKKAVLGFIPEEEIVDILHQQNQN